MRQSAELPFGWTRVVGVSSVAIALAVQALALPPGVHGRTAARGAAQQAPVSNEVPSMDNDSLYTPPPPLPASWPAGARDAQFRGAACEEGYSPDAARRKGEAGDEALPAFAQVAPGLPSPFVAVRRVPFLTKRDVLRALFSAAENGTYVVSLKLTDDGAKKIQEYTAAHKDDCIALVAGGKVLWHPTLSEPVTDDTFVLDGDFSISVAQAITNLFNE
jgi:hypothetical protein